MTVTKDLSQELEARLAALREIVEPAQEVGSEEKKVGELGDEELRRLFSLRQALVDEYATFAIRETERPSDEVARNGFDARWAEIMELLSLFREAHQRLSEGLSRKFGAVVDSRLEVRQGWVVVRTSQDEEVGEVWACDSHGRKFFIPLHINQMEEDV